MKKLSLKVLALTVTVLFSLPVWADGDWEEAKNQEGIKIDTRRVEGAPMKEFRAEGMIDAPIEVAWEVLIDSASYPKWFGDCIVHKIIETEDKNISVGYHAVDIPFPFSDRDTVAFINLETDWKTGKASKSMVSIGSPEDAKYGMDDLTREEGRVRMPKMHGHFLLTRVSPTQTNMLYQAHADPGVPLPGWLLNMLATNQPYKTFIGIRKEVKNIKYFERAEKVHDKKFKP